jgi:hypothetical protein
MSEPWPDDAPHEWDRCELGRLELPGLVRVRVRMSQEIDVKKPKGAHGATTTLQGINPARVTITLRMWNAEQFRTFQAVVVPLRSKVGKGDEKGAVDIEHPKTKMWGIRAVLIQEIDDDAGEQGDLYDVTFDCIEHRPSSATNATKTPKAPDTLGASDPNAIRKPDPPSASGATP